MRRISIYYKIVIPLTGIVLFMIFRPVGGQDKILQKYRINSAYTLLSSGQGKLTNIGEAMKSTKKKKEEAEAEKSKSKTKDYSKLQGRDKQIAELIDWAKSKIGHPYQFGGTGGAFSPEYSAQCVSWAGGKNAWNVLGSEAQQYAGMDCYDCSGFVQAAYKYIGIDIPRGTSEQAFCGNAVDMNDLQPGDIIVTSDPSKHVVMYLGDDQIIEAPYTGAFIRIMPLGNRSDLTRPRRII